MSIRNHPKADEIYFKHLELMDKLQRQVMVNNRLNYKQFEIFSFTSAKTRSCAKFKYKGYIISMSTVFEPNIKVFDIDETIEYADVETVQDAIKFVDSLVVD